MNLPRDLCKPEALGKIRQGLGAKEEELIANVCGIKATADEILSKFREISDSQQVHPDAPIDVGEELSFYNTKLDRIRNLAENTKVR